MLKRVQIFAGALFAFSTTDAAVALEYCVTCEGPPAMYRCLIDGTEDGPGRDPSASLYCISQMAAKGGHQSCAVSRGAPFPCPGLTAVVEQPRDLPARTATPPAEVPGVTDTAATEAADPVETDESPVAAAPSNKVPRTMEELAGQTVKSSKEGLKQAGDAIGGTAKKAGEQIGNAGSAIGNAATKTWGCITSLFSACGRSEADVEALPENSSVEN